MSNVQKIFAAEDWTKLYTAYSQIDLSSYDFDNLRRVLLDYVKTNFSEDFNDFIESSEFIALIDMMAYLGQSLAFRIDLNSRENFIDTATKQDSVISLARLVGYTPKRNIAASGMLKLNNISTSQNINDSNGNSLTNVNVIWNDSTNPNYQEQFNIILNQAMSSGQQVGNPAQRSVINGITTEIYEINSLNSSPVLPFSQSIGGVSMNFELVGGTINSDKELVERIPIPNSGFNLIYQNDGKGNGSPNTGWFVMFKQGTLNNTNFGISTALPNQVLSVNVNNINNTDTWLFQLDANGNFTTLWKQVPETSGTNVIYNSIAQNIRTIYSIVGRASDQVDLVFADGTFGQIPNGNFTFFFRVSNALSYQITPADMTSVVASLNVRNQNASLSALNMNFTLKQTVANSSPPEDFNSVKVNAPQSYYTQNRMITGEDYNIYPLISNQNVLKIKAVNRTSSGVNRYLDIIDPTGKYSSVKIFADDGVIYQNTTADTTTFVWSSAASDIAAVIQNTLNPYLVNEEFTNFYYVNFPRVDFSTTGLIWEALHSSNGSYDGYFNNANGVPQAFGPSAGAYPYTAPSTGTLLKFVAPSGYYFDNNQNLIPGQPSTGSSTYLWVRIMSLVGDGRNYGAGALSTGAGPIVLSSKVPSNAILVEAIPQISRDFGSLTTSIYDGIAAQVDFGIGYDQATTSWYYIDSRNLSNSSKFNLAHAQDTSNTNSDASWLIKLQYRNASYTVSARVLQTIFHSVSQNQFYYDSDELIKDPLTGEVVSDKVYVLKTNGNWDNYYLPYLNDIRFHIIGNVQQVDGYIDPTSVRLGFADSNGNQIPVDPDSFGLVLNLETVSAATAIASVGGGTVQAISVVNGGSGYVTAPSVVITGNGSGATATAEISAGSVIAINITNPGTNYSVASVYVDPGVKKYGFSQNDFVVVLQRYMDSSGFYDWQLYLDTNTMIVVDQLSNIGTTDPTGNAYVDGQLIYARSTGTVYVWNSSSGNYFSTPDYKAYRGRSSLQFKYEHNASDSRRIDPALSNIIDLYVLTSNYSSNFQNWLINDRTLANKPSPPTAQELYTLLNNIESVKGMSDEIIYNPVEYMVLFGSLADLAYQANFQVVPNSNTLVSDNEIVTRVVNAINLFFANANYDFGDTFYFTELAAYVHLQLAGLISSIVLVPVSTTSEFGDLFQITSLPNQIMIQDVSAANVIIVNSVTPATIKN